VWCSPAGCFFYQKNITVEKKNDCWLNFYISISGIITFPNTHELREVVKSYPLDKILVETDAPFLTPVPLRGKINEPAYIKHTVEYLSEIFGLSAKNFSNITTKNFLALFNKVNHAHGLFE